VRAVAPRALDDVHVEAEALHHVDPQVAELTVAERDDFVARRQRVRQRRLPAAGAGAGEDEGGAFLCLEEVLAVRKHVFEEGREEGVAVVLTWDGHRPPDAFVDVDWPCTRACRYAELQWGAGMEHLS
jgi:hypothetical protein